MNFSIPVSRQLEFFRKFVSDVTNIHQVEYMYSGQAIQRNSKNPWIQLEFDRIFREEPEEETEDNGDRLRYVVQINHRAMVNVHCKFRESNDFTALGTALYLQNILSHKEVRKALCTEGISIAQPGDNESEEAIEKEVEEIDRRYEVSYYFPIILVMTNVINTPLLDSHWFNKFDLTTEMEEADDRLDLDNERFD